MMSIFSSFDAFCAESYGQKLKFSKPKDDGNNNNNNNNVSDRVKKMNPDSSRSTSTSTPPPANDVDKIAQQKRNMRRLPRFALELDGVNCFETIVPY